MSLRGEALQKLRDDLEVWGLDLEDFKSVEEAEAYLEDEVSSWVDKNS